MTKDFFRFIVIAMLAGIAFGIAHMGDSRTLGRVGLLQPGAGFDLDTPASAPSTATATALGALGEKAARVTELLEQCAFVGQALEPRDLPVNTAATGGDRI